MIELTGTRRRYSTGDLILLHPESHRVVVGTATASRNEMTGSWFVSGQKGESDPYLVDSESIAIRLALTVDHFNRTGEHKRFPRSAYKIKWVYESK